MEITDTHYLDIARKHFTSDSDRDLHDLAFIEVFFAIGDTKIVLGLDWRSVLTKRKCIVLETIDNVVEACYPLSDEAFTALENLHKRVLEISVRTRTEYPSFMFPQLRSGVFYTSWGWHRTNGNAAYYIERRIKAEIDKEERLARIASLDQAYMKSLEQKISKTQLALQSLRLQLEHYRVTGTKKRFNSKELLSPTELKSKWLSEEHVKYANVLIEDLDLSTRVFNSLKRSQITTVCDVLDRLAIGSDAMLALRNFGEKALDELVDRLKEKGYQ